MNSCIKKQLEGMAGIAVGGPSDDYRLIRAYMLGAEAAWDLAQKHYQSIMQDMNIKASFEATEYAERAVKAERERCAKVWSDLDDRWLPDVLEFLDPSEDGA